MNVTIHYLHTDKLLDEIIKFDLYQDQLLLDSLIYQHHTSLCLTYEWELDENASKEMVH
jgi:hypothetical protein